MDVASIPIGAPVSAVDVVWDTEAGSGAQVANVSAPSQINFFNSPILSKVEASALAEGRSKLATARPTAQQISEA